MLPAAAGIAARYGQLILTVSKALPPLDHKVRQPSAHAALAETLRQAG
ncbi:hypothetical protein ACIPSE_46505 [Streptomyces sp. NPDC090106]